MKLLLTRLSLVLLPALLAGACQDDNPTPQSSSATHFLERCASTCPSGLECVCGVCTRKCASNAECEPIVDHASCVAIADLQPACTQAPMSFVCALACNSDSD